MDPRVRPEDDSVVLTGTYKRIVTLGLDPRVHRTVLNVKDYYVYILASGARGTLYIGVTNNLIRRVYEHKSGATSGFTRKYAVKKLVWYEVHEDIKAAIQREKSLKRWYRAWKIDLVEAQNPESRDLYDDFSG